MAAENSPSAMGCIKKATKMKFLVSQILSIFLICTLQEASAHSGRTNSDGCHNNRSTGGYHCHNPKSTFSPGSSRGGQNFLNKSLSEDQYNDALANKVNALRETQHNYTTAQGERSFIRVDLETPYHVVEGGLDKRSSLDSIQQALFAAHLTGKKPIVVIFDTDETEGRFEFRIRIAAEKAGVRFYRLSLRDIKTFSGF